MSSAPLNIAENIFLRHPASATAIITEDSHLSYGDLNQRSSAIVKELRATLATSPAKRIALRAHGSPHYIVTALAILRYGACFIPVPEELAEPEQQKLLSTTAAETLVTICTDGNLKITRLSPPPPSFPCNQFHNLNPAFIRFSSGTTGKAKGVVISHQSLLERIHTANHALAISPQDRIFWALPMAHHFAVSIILYLYFGASTILSDQHLGAEMLRAMKKHGATIFYGSPFHIKLLSAAAATCDASPRLRKIISTASKLDASTAETFFAAFGIPVTQALGIIEAGLPIINNDPQEASQCPTSIGRPNRTFEARVNSSGLLQIRGPGMFDAYLHPWQLRSEVVDEDGWFSTGDIAEVDAQGLFHLKGRAISCINVGGLKCFPEEIEAILNSHPAIRASRVFSRPNPITGFSPAAEIVPADPSNPPTIATIIKHCREHLAAYKIPLSIQTVTAIQTTPSGKIPRNTDIATVPLNTTPSC